MERNILVANLANISLKTNMELTRREFLKTTVGALAGAILTACGVDPNSPTYNLDSNVDDTPTSLPTKTVKENQEIHDEIAKSFLETHPEFEGREMGNLAFSINGVVSDTIIIKANEAEQEEINSFKNTFNGVELQPYDKAVVFTQKTSPDGSTEWVRLSGVWFPTEDGTVNTAWYYSTDAFDKNKEPIEFNQKVFAFNSKDPTYLFWPIMNPPNKLLWSADLTSTDPKNYKEWDGVEPFIWSMGSDIKNGVGKALFAPMPEVESPLPEGPISELQKTLGDKYKLKAEDDHYVIDGIDNLKFSPTGTAYFNYDGDEMAVSRRAIEVNGENLNIAGWQFTKEGEMTMITSGAPSPESTPEQLAEWKAKLAKFAIDEGLPLDEQKKIDLTIHKYVQMATAETAAGEFENIYVDGKKVEVEISPYWEAFPSSGNKYMILDSEVQHNQLIALESGYAHLVVYDASGKVKSESNIMPTLVRNTKGSIFSMVTLTDDNDFSRILEFLTKEKRTELWSVLFISAYDNEDEAFFADINQQIFTAEHNKEILIKIESFVDVLPEKELTEMGFWSIVH